MSHNTVKKKSEFVKEKVQNCIYFIYKSIEVNEQNKKNMYIIRIPFSV